MLERLGARVDVIDFPKMTNSQDLNATVKVANEGGYDFGISLHCDSASTEKRLKQTKERNSFTFQILLRMAPMYVSTREALKEAGLPYASRNLFPGCCPDGPTPCSRARASPS